MRPLDGVRVLEMGQYISGRRTARCCWPTRAPTSSRSSGPAVGDPRRSYDPLVDAADGRSTSGGFLSYNRNKRSVDTQPAAPAGQQILA